MEYTKGSGYIELILGGMFCGKTSELLRIFRKHKQLQRKCIIIKYSKDTRYSTTGISTHDLIVQSEDVYTSGKNLSEIYDKCKGCDVVCIDEGQFYPDLPEFAEKLANEGKIVVIAGLDGTFNRDPFGRILEVIPKAEKVKKLHGICSICRKRDACFSKLRSDIIVKGVELIGGAEKYIAVCRKCYFEKN